MIIFKNRYDAWGAIVSETETINNSHKYAGQYYDDDTGLIYLRARYYDPQDRRFTQEDPARDELNWYAYCNNNPVMFVDPSGCAEVGDEYLSYDDQMRIRALTYMYNLTDVTAEKEAYRRAAVKIRQQYKNIYENSDKNGIYEDNYNYVASGFKLTASVVILSEGHAWLEGGNNRKNDKAMNSVTQIPNGGVIDVLDAIETTVNSLDKEYYSAAEQLKKGDIRVEISGYNNSGVTFLRVRRGSIYRMLSYRKKNGNIDNVYVNPYFQ